MDRLSKNTENGYSSFSWPPCCIAAGSSPKNEKKSQNFCKYRMNYDIQQKDIDIKSPV